MDYRVKSVEYTLAAILICVIMIMACVVAVHSEEQPIAVIYTDSYIEKLNRQKTEVGIAPETADATDKSIDSTIKSIKSIDESTSAPGKSLASTSQDLAFQYGNSLPYYFDMVPDTRMEVQLAWVRLDSGFMYIPDIPLSIGEQLTIFRLTDEAGIPWHVALGIIDRETDGKFDKSAVNHNTHDYGLWQINRRSWLGKAKKMLGISSMNDLLDVERNTMMGVYILSDCISRYGLNERAYVAYNAGWGYTASNDYSRDVAARSEKWKLAMDMHDTGDRR